MTHAASAWSAFAAVRRESPLVHNITNYVSMDVAANGLLAAGASPAMVHAVEEVEDFVAIASALVVNIGTLSPPWVEAMERAADRARELGKPWVLDPVGAGATPYRTGVARTLARRWPTIIRGNASEILALVEEGRAGKGVDSAHGSDEAREVARALAGELECVVAVTGSVDYVTDGETVLAVDNGHPLMARVTALGCTASALAGAFAAVEPDPLRAAAYALGVFGLAGEVAARESPGPGTLRWRILDALHTLDERTVMEGVRIS
jgi:hydroxyethylthiazole kinase